MQRKQIHSLDELRGAAALAVAACHVPCFNHPLIVGYGEFPVLLFIMLSAFLCMYSSDIQKEFRLIKRLLRICPLYYLITFFTYALATIRPSFFNTTTATPVNLIKSLLFIPYANPNGMIRPILDVGWTLSAEVLFYLVFFLASKLCFQHRGAITGSFFAALYALGALFFPSSSLFSLYKKSFLAAAVGILLYMFWKAHLQMTPKRTSGRTLYGLLPYVLLWGCMAVCSFFSANALLIVFLAALTFFAFLCKPDAPHFSDLFRFIGRISFSLYLTHEFIIKGFDRLVFPLRTLRPLPVALALVCVLVSIIGAYITHRFVEQRLRPEKLFMKHSI